MADTVELLLKRIEESHIESENEFINGESVETNTDPENSDEVKKVRKIDYTTPNQKKKKGRKHKKSHPSTHNVRRPNTCYASDAPKPPVDPAVQKTVEISMGELGE